MPFMCHLLPWVLRHDAEHVHNAARQPSWGSQAKVGDSASDTKFVLFDSMETVEDSFTIMVITKTKK